MTSGPSDSRGPSDSPILFYREEGRGLPVVLLHGFAEDGAIWNNQAVYLTAYCRVIIPNLPASGIFVASGLSPGSHLSPESRLSPGSGLSPAAEAVSMEELAEKVLELLDHLGIEKCILIGHSMGGYIALAFAQANPERLIALGLFHSTAYADDEEKIATRRKSIAFIRNNGAAPFIRQSTANLFSSYTREHDPGLISGMIDRYSSFSPDALISYYEAMIIRPDRTAVLRQFDGPVLFIAGALDTLIPIGHSLEQCHLPAISHFHILENAGHSGMLEAPERSNAIIHSFLNFVQYS
jgi:pimeloyl-ACP methyl ester carboxylesterase